MLSLLTKEASFAWAVGLTIGTPLLLLVLGEIMARIRRREHPILCTLANIRHFVVPCAAAYLLVVHVAEVDRSTVAVRILLTLLVLSVLNAVLSLCNALLFAQAAPSTWQARTPKLVRELARFGLVILGGGLALSTVWRIDLGSVLAALGVGSVVLGLALQEPLGNLFSGLMLTFERPFEVGDWIQVGDKGGEVVEINWRAVHIRTASQDMQIIPNSALAKNQFCNHSRPTPLVAETLEVTLPASVPPNQAKDLLLSVAVTTPGLLTSPAPVVQTAKLEPGGSTIVYKVLYAVASQAQASAIRDELLTRLWYAVGRAGLSKQEPAETCVVERWMRAFQPLGLDRVAEIDEMLRDKQEQRYARGERVLRAGEAFEGLCLLLAGEVRLSVPDLAGREHELVRLGPGQVFGEKALLSCQASDVTATAETDIVVLILGGERLQAILDRAPRLARQIGQIMETRRQAREGLHGVNRQGVFRRAG